MSITIQRKINERYRQYRKENKEKLKKDYENNKDEILEKQKEYYEKNKKEISERTKQYREQNKEKLKARKAKYREENREILRDKDRKYRAANKEKRAEQSARSREKNRENTRKKDRERYQLNKEQLRERSNHYYHTHKEKFSEYNKKYQQTPNGRYQTYKSRAKRKGWDFGYTLEDFHNMFDNTTCHYCGDKIVGIGIDRLDNKLGYTKENTVPCCTTCNNMKYIYDHDFFINHITIISQFQNNFSCYSHLNNPSSTKFYSTLKGQAKFRGIEFTITKDFMLDMLMSTCNYCGSEHFIGIDRIDSSNGYHSDNVVPCCKYCNMMKGSLDKSEFLSKVNQTYKNKMLIRIEKNIWINNKDHL